MTRTPLRNISLIAGLHTVVFLAFLNYLRRAFDLSTWMLAVHLPLLLFAIGMSVLLASAAAAAPLVRGRRATPYIAATLPAAVGTLLVILYVANLATNLWLGVNVTHKLADLWLTDWFRGGHILPVSVEVAWAAIGISTAIFVLEVVIWGRALRSPLTLPRNRGVAMAAIVLALGYAIFFHQLSWRTPRSYLLSADPILAFMRTTVAVEDETQRDIFARLRTEEPRIRAEYPRLDFDRKNVIIIIVDSLRADHLPLYGYERKTTPFLSGLAEKGLLRKVDFATSTCAESNCGILSTMFSKTLRHQVVEDFSLFNLLHDQGYDTRFILSGNHDWQGLREMYGTGHTQYFDGEQSKRHSWSDDAVIDEGMESVPAFSKPTFFFFHLMSVHLLGVKHDQFKIFQPSAVQNSWEALFRGEYDRESVTNNYDNGVLQADAKIKDIFETLDRKGYLHNSIAVILSDHGEGLGDHGPRNFGHVTSLYQEMIRIPILIYDNPSVEYGSLDFGTQMDIAPTIVDRLGLPLPSSWEGISLRQPTSPRFTVHQTTMTTPCFAIIERDAEKLLKYMHCAIGRREELYDLSNDPNEDHDIAATVDPAILERFRARLNDWRTK